MRFGYYAQAHEGLDAKNTVIEEIRSVRAMTEDAARDLLGKMLFSGDNVYKLIGDLSGGERSRVALTKLMLTDANFLILDEPTNHLDLDAQDAITEVLNAYDGTILFVSHDRAFIDDIATQVWARGTTARSPPGRQLRRIPGRESPPRRVGPARAHTTNGTGPKPDVRDQSKSVQRQDRAAERERARMGKRKQEAEASISALKPASTLCPTPSPKPPNAATSTPS